MHCFQETTEKIHGFQYFQKILTWHVKTVDRNSADRIPTRYGLNGLGIETWWGGVGRFSAPVHTGLGPPSLLYNEYRVFPGGKAAEGWRWTPPTFSA